MTINSSLSRRQLLARAGGGAGMLALAGFCPVLFNLNEFGYLE
jgi:hypothetical protein